MIKRAALKPVILLALSFFLLTNLLKASADTLPNVWINEIHYANTGDDTLQGFEIAGPATTNLACYRVFVYDGSTQSYYSIDTLSGVITNQQSGFGTVWFGLQQGLIQNTNTGGFALQFAPQATGCGVAGTDTLVQFLSYGTGFYGTNGPALGYLSSLIAVQENTASVVGNSLQLGGNGAKYGDFTWQTSLPETYNQRNTNQTFVTADPIVEFVVTSESISERGGAQGIAVLIYNPNTFATRVDINVLPGGTAQNQVNFTYSPITMTFPANTGYDQIITVTPIDDSVADGNKTFTFRLAYPSNNASLGADSEFVVTILDADSLYINMPEPAVTVAKNVGVVMVPVNLNLKSTDATSVQISLGAGTTAVQGVDFSFNDTTITWIPGTRGTILVPVTVIDNSVLETDKTVQLQLTNANNNALIENGNFNLTILETHDTVKTTIQFVGIDTTVPQGAGYVPVIFEVNNASGSQDTLYLVADNNLSTGLYGFGDGYDYFFGNQEFDNYFASGITYDTQYVLIETNNLISPTKTAVFRFTNLSSNVRVLSDSIYTVYITNDNKFVVTFAGAGYSYPNDTALVKVPVALTTFSAFPTSVDVTLAPGSAVKGVDYNFNDTTVVFPAFSTDTQGVWVQIIPNNIIQPNKQINFNLSNPTNGAILGIAGYTLTIVNDDSIVQSIGAVYENKDVKLFPNPVTNTLHLQSDKGPGEVRITDLPGNTVYSNAHLGAGQNAIDVSNISAGVYLITFRRQDSSITSRFVKVE